jgi:polyisoprenoid-binding protein YceI
MLERERWEIDGSRSTLAFGLRHFVVGEIEGRFGRWGGTLLLDPAHFGRSLLAVWIDLASLDTGSTERDAHLRSPELLDADRFPRAEFRSAGVALRANGDAVVSGQLDLHGVTGSVELEVTSERTGPGQASMQRPLYTVHGHFDRQAFGLHWNQDLDIGGFVVGDNVELTAHVELIRTPETDRASAPETARASRDAP